MPYKFAVKTDYTDLSGGKVIYHSAGFTNFPIRLACEIFMRCLTLLAQPESSVSVYDPCCGGGYLLTVLGFLYNDTIRCLYGSDVSPEALALSEKNLRLLTPQGLHSRKDALKALYDTYGKDAHGQAIVAAENLMTLLKKPIRSQVFLRNILEAKQENHTVPVVDIVFTDVPYGKLASWSEDEPFAIDMMLDALSRQVNRQSVIAVSSDKRQKITNPDYQRLDKFQVGKRKIEILQRRM